MKKHTVTVIRTGIAARDMVVEAPTYEKAVCKALDEAGNHEFREHHSDYSVPGSTNHEGRLVLRQPLTARQIRAMAKANNGQLKGVVAYELGELIVAGVEGFNDMLSEKLTGTELLTDISYRVVGHDGSEILIAVEGSAEHILPNL